MYNAQPPTHPTSETQDQRTVEVVTIPISKNASSSFGSEMDERKNRR